MSEQKTIFEEIEPCEVAAIAEAETGIDAGAGS
jgi:hypothetical protein